MDRRTFVNGLAMAGAVGSFGLRSVPADAEPPPEVRTVRLTQTPAICFAPIYVAEELLRAEGFTEVQWTKTVIGVEALLKGNADFSSSDVGSFIKLVDGGRPVVGLTGLHAGCYELFATDRIRTMRDLKGKAVAIPGLHSGRHLFLSAMMAYVGLDPRKDVKWVEQPARESMQLLAEGKIDAFLGFPPEPQELRAKRIGRLIVSTTSDRPWSEYFCCFLLGQREFVQKHPVATRRVMRAILKANAICSLEPERAARYLVDRGFTTAYEYAVQTLRELPYGKWRERDPADSIRFHAVRLHEVGMVKASPQKIIADGTDWRFLNELKKELKG